jgi:hypothetical protein
MRDVVKILIPAICFLQEIVPVAFASDDRIPALRGALGDRFDELEQVTMLKRKLVDSVESPDRIDDDRISRPSVTAEVTEGRDKHALTDSATTILEGMLQAFLARPEFRDAEVRCTSKNVEKLARDVMTASEHTVLELSEALKPLGDARSSHDRNFPLPAISDGLVTIIQLQGNLANSCMQGRSLDTFNLAAHHLRNLSYVGGHLLANGADIIPELKDALESFRSGKLHSFGEDLGRAWRKVLLSKAQALPGNREALQETSRGLVEGFFSENLHLDTASNKEHGEQGENFGVDPHKCIKGQNERFFQEVWNAAWLFFERVAKMQPVTDQQWKAVLAVVLADLPSAMRYCGMSKAQEDSLIHSIKALEKLRFNVDVPHQTVNTAEVSVDLAQAVDHWRNHQWHDFGMNLGKLLQELVLLVLPSKHSLYSRDFSVDRPIHFVSQRAAPRTLRFSVGWIVAAVAVASWFFALVASVAMRGCSHSRQPSRKLLATTSDSDVEGVDDVAEE